LLSHTDTHFSRYFAVTKNQLLMTASTAHHVTNLTPGSDDPHPGALGLISGHRVTGDPMPADMVRRLRRGKALFGATDLQQQIVFALTDLEAHARGGRGGGGTSVSELAAEVQRQHSLMPVVGLALFTTLRYFADKT
jgi:hypothetical protein